MQFIFVYYDRTYKKGDVRSSNHKGTISPYQKSPVISLLIMSAQAMNVWLALAVRHVEKGYNKK